jgi:hypothetical protein
VPGGLPRPTYDQRTSVNTAAPSQSYPPRHSSVGPVRSAAHNRLSGSGVSLVALDQRGDRSSYGAGLSSAAGEWPVNRPARCGAS